VLVHEDAGLAVADASHAARKPAKLNKWEGRRHRFRQRRPPRFPCQAPRGGAAEVLVIIS
jgi:hypothetical protein